MNQEIKEEWVELLRSDEYQQCQGLLHNASGGFCCLGVLTDLYIKKVQPVTGWVKENSNNWYKFMGEEEILPEVVQSWAGLPAMPEAMTSGGETRHLTDMNDSGVSFKEIADLIEAQL